MRRPDLGSVTVLVAVGALLVATLVGVGLMVGVRTLVGHRVQGAADLAALAGARELSAGGDPCEAARRSAGLARVRVISCVPTGDEYDFVVAVEVQGDGGVRPLGLGLEARATAYAGSLDGVP